MLNRIDNWHSDWNFLSATKAQRYTALAMSGIALFLWAVRGWDSGITQYGTSLHYSVFVIYGLEYFVLNWSLDTVEEIRGIRNLIISVLWTTFSLAVFEWYWGIGYAVLRGELWVLTAQNSVYTELIAITIFGALGGLLAIKWGVKPTLDWLTLFLCLPAIMWILSGFEQTCYPKLDGTVIYIENNLVHFYNVVAKATLAMATARTFIHERPGRMRLQFILAILCVLVWGIFQKLKKNLCYGLQILITNIEY